MHPVVSYCSIELANLGVAWEAIAVPSGGNEHPPLSLRLGTGLEI